MQPLSRLRVLCLISILLCSEVSSLAQSANPKLGIPEYSGEACPAGSVVAQLSPDSRSLSILWDRFSTEAGSREAKNYHRKTCILRLPLVVPPGMQASITRIDYRGFYSLPLRGYAQFTTEFSLDGLKTPRLYRRIVGPVDKDFLTTYQLGPQDTKWTACGKSAVLDITTSLIVMTNEHGDQSMATLDSADLGGDAGLSYSLNWKKCR